MKTLSLGSKLTFNQTNEFVDTVQKVLADGEKDIQVDMSSCNFLNSIMLSGLIRSLKLCEKNQGSLLLLGVSPAVMTLLNTTNVRSLFTIEEKVEEPSSPLSLSFELKEKYGTFRLSGSLDASSQCQEFRAFYEEHLPTVENGVLECSELHHLGSSGVNELFRLRGILHEKKGKLLLLGETDSVASVWKMMHLDSLIPKVESQEAAAALFSQEA